MKVVSSLPEAVLGRLRELLRTTYFRWIPAEALTSDDGRFIVEQHVWQRYEQARSLLGPWVDRAVGLRGRRVVEIGCGTGSSTAGFAPLVGRIDGYEIDQLSVDAARGRFQVLGIENATATRVDAPTLITTALERHAGQVDGVLLYAVLEHMTVGERIDTLRRTWAAIPAGGFLVVIETPNRLTWTDLHTSHLPFFHQLPIELAEHYYRHSPRRDFVTAVDKEAPADRPMALMRWGTGVSYHEFDVALGAGVDGWIRADGFEAEVTAVYPVRVDDELLLRYFETAKVGRHRAFTRNHLNFVLQKP